MTRKRQNIERKSKYEIRAEKQNCIKEQYHEMEIVNQNMTHSTYYGNVKEAAGIFKIRTADMLINGDGQIKTDRKEKICKWKIYIRDLFEYYWPEHSPVRDILDNLPIALKQVKHVISQLTAEFTDQRTFVMNFWNL